jgi:7-carboxy-7-deazaguanine synthase
VPLRLNELYVSVQGEGPHVGEPTIFVRFSGCNMRCAGWPCDTQHAIQPALYRHDPKLPPQDIVDQIMGLRDQTGARRVCITGGEPFMQDAEDLFILHRKLCSRGFDFDIFTNGSFIFPDWVTTDWVTIIMDWKLEGSGEAQKKGDERLWNVEHRLQRKDAIKFTVVDKDDLQEARHFWEAFKEVGCQFYVGRVWEHALTDDDVVQFILNNQLPWKHTMQVHKYIWPGVERGI